MLPLEKHAHVKFQLSIIYPNRLFSSKFQYFLKNIQTLPILQKFQIEHSKKHLLPKFEPLQKNIVRVRWTFWSHLRQMIYLSRADDISSFAVEYHLLSTIVSYVAWYSSPADDIQLKQMILIWRGRYLSRADDIHPVETIFIQERRISSMMGDSWNYNQPLEMILNQWVS
jgi:hypothetical protein